jgi:hypothetical protein
MRKAWLTAAAACLAANLSAATITTQITSLGGNLYREAFSINGLTVAMNDSLDIAFDPTQYGTLSNGVAMPSSNWSVTLNQPNVPFPGLNGDYIITALVNNPSLAGPFSVDVTFLGMGQPNGVNSFTLFDSNFNPVPGGSGTTAGPQSGVPEPATFPLVGAGLWISAVLLRRRSAHKRSF